MMTGYTKVQFDGVVDLYRELEQEYQGLIAEAEELLSEGNYTQRERVLKVADNKWWEKRGILAAAEAVGIPEETVRDAARRMEKKRKR